MQSLTSVLPASSASGHPILPPQEFFVHQSCIAGMSWLKETLLVACSPRTETSQTWRLIGKAVGSHMLPMDPHQNGRAWVCFYLEPSSPGISLPLTGESGVFSLCLTCSQREKEGARGCAFPIMATKQEAHASPPPAPENAVLRGALTPACILINIIPPSINSKSTYFTPGEKNNPRLVSPASPGAAEGLNPPHPYSPLPPFSLGSADRARCSSVPWHQKVAAWEHGKIGWGALVDRHNTGTHPRFCTLLSSDQCMMGISITISTEGVLLIGKRTPRDR